MSGDVLAKLGLNKDVRGYFHYNEDGERIYVPLSQSIIAKLKQAIVTEGDYSLTESEVDALKTTLDVDIKDGKSYITEDDGRQIPSGLNASQLWYASNPSRYGEYMALTLQSIEDCLFNYARGMAQMLYLISRKWDMPNLYPLDRQRLMELIRLAESRPLNAYEQFSVLREGMEYVRTALANSTEWYMDIGSHAVTFEDILAELGYSRKRS